MLSASLLLVLSATAAPPPELDAAAAARFAGLALSCVHREYPNKIAHVLHSEADARPPRALTPAFYGCFDWHSSVHGHWLLARLARLFPDAAFAPAARAALGRSLTAENIAGELAYLAQGGREEFERPYGLAWLLQLAAELREWDDPLARRLAANLAPLESEAVRRIRAWLPKLAYPIRAGEHSQTAFAFGLITDWAATSGDRELFDLVRARGHAFYFADRGCPLSYEPSGQAFLSPCLAEADLARRFMAPARFAAWLGGLLPEVPLDDGGWLEPGIVTDPSDGKLVHLHGLNLSRAWMLQGIAAGLPAADPRRPALLGAAARHAEASLPAVSDEHYAGGHWLATFAVYLLTERGVKDRPAAP